MKKIDFECTECGSREVRVDAYSQWSVEQQEFEHVSDHGNWVCEPCGGECAVEEVIVEIGEKVACAKQSPDNPK